MISHLDKPVIVALDVCNTKQAIELVKQLEPRLCAVKVGFQLFTAEGPTVVKKLVAMGFRVFLDLKYHDIPNTVANACVAAADLGVWMLNVHATGGMQMMQTARKALDGFGARRPLLIAVTVLTSMSQTELSTIGFETTMSKQVASLASLSHHAGLDGVVCSAQESALVKMTCGDAFLTVTPGIRLPNDECDDQSRVMTPEKALKSGSDYLVMGRSITRAPSPQALIKSINEIKA